jgi:hypothetical protein
MQALLLSKSVHVATPIEQYGPGISSSFSFMLVTCSWAKLIDVAGICEPRMLMLAFISIIFAILGFEQTLSACTGHAPQMQLISTSSVNGTLPSFLPNSGKRSPPQNLL